MPPRSHLGVSASRSRCRRRWPDDARPRRSIWRAAR